MFCTKCGHECSNDTLFCVHCGEKLFSDETTVQEQNAKTQLSINEYFDSEASVASVKHQSILKKLSYISIIIQFSLFILGVIVNILISPLLFFRFTLLMSISEFLFLVITLGFLKKGIKKKSPGFLFASLPFALFSTCLGTVIAISIPVINIIVLSIIAVIHIVMIILNNKDVKEFKDYLNKNE